MTTTKGGPARARVRADAAPLTVIGAWRRALLAQLEAEHRIVFPSVKYRTDPVGFGRDVLGVETWADIARASGCTREQVAKIGEHDAPALVLNAVRDHNRVTWRSGRRVSKSFVVAWLALWFYACWEYARVIMSSTTARQVDAILWRQLAIMRAQSGRCATCRRVDPCMTKIPKPCPHSAVIDGEIGILARTGLKSTDDLYREVWGFTASESEAVQGFAGPRVLYALDEASGIPELIYEAIDGNAVAGTKILLTGNPTKTSGRFFRSHTKDAKDAKDANAIGWVAFQTSSYQSPNIIARRVLVEGLADEEWIATRAKEWGAESPLFRVHVLGEFATNEDGKVFSIERIEAAKARWMPATTKRELADALSRGLRPLPLYIGIDPAGATGTGDESSFTPRRGMMAEAALVERGLTADDHLTRLLSMIDARALEREVAIVVIDRTGAVGSELFGRLVAYQSERERNRLPPRFHLVGVKFSDKAQRRPDIYDTMRDELYANLEQAFREGAAIAEDVKLEAELHAVEWKIQVSGRTKITPKDEIKRELGRSPDRCDSLALAFWEEASLAAKDYAPAEPVRAARDDEDEDAADIYNAERAWRR